MSQLNLEPTKPKRRWFQFSLKSFFLFILIIGCGSGITLRVFLRKLSKQEEIERFCNNHAKDNTWEIFVVGEELSLLREGKCSKVDDQELEEISRLRCLSSVTFRWSRISNEGLMKLKDAENLKSLTFDRSYVDWDALKRLNESRRSNKIRIRIFDPPNVEF
jgi:hypothetical protein